MKVSVKILGALIKPFGKNDFEYECKNGITVEKLLEEFNYKKNHIPHIIVAINNEKKGLDTMLNNKDKIILSITSGGG